MLWFKIRKQVKILKKAGMQKYLSKKELKCIAELIVRQQDFVLVENKPL
jgi:hypothetical protein